MSEVAGSALHFVVPGALDQRTGGYLYDARIVAGLRDQGWHVTVHELEGSFPAPTRVSEVSLRRSLSAVPDEGRVVIDGLAMGALPGPVSEHGTRLRILALVHHPLADETGLVAEDRIRFEELEREGLAACRGVITTSESTARRVRKYGVDRSRVRSVRPGTDRAPLATGPPTGQPPVLLCVASVTPRKGQDVLMDALAQVADLPWSCTCVGSLDRDPDFAQQVVARAAQLGLADRVRFAGECDDARLQVHYDEASLFVLASHFEGYGMALAEALVRGLPVVSTTGGAIEATVPSDAGVLVEPGSASAFASALRAFLGDHDPVGAIPGDARQRHETGLERRGRYSAAARRYAAHVPTWERSALMFADAVTELAALPPQEAESY